MVAATDGVRPATRRRGRARPRRLVAGRDAVLVLGSYVPLLVLVALNRGTPGMWLIGLGILMNFTVIVANSGMPVMSEAAYVAGGTNADADIVASAKHVLLDTSTALPFLADVIPLRLFGFGQVISLGDVFLAVGLAQGPRARTASAGPVVQARGTHRGGIGRQAVTKPLPGGSADSTFPGTGDAVVTPHYLATAAAIESARCWGQRGRRRHRCRCRPRSGRSRGLRHRRRPLRPGAPPRGPGTGDTQCIGTSRVGRRRSSDAWARAMPRSRGTTRRPQRCRDAWTVGIALDDHFGALPLHGLLARAVALAEDGFEASDELATSLRRLESRLSDQPAADGLYPDGIRSRSG